MYWLKLRRGNKLSVVEPDFREALKHLDFRRQIVNANSNQYRKVVTSPSGARFFGDSCASVMAYLFNEGHGNQEVLRHALQYSELMLTELGYTSFNAARLRSLVTLDNVNAVLVAGCQGQPLRDSRAKAARALVAAFPEVSFDLVFSGRTPPDRAQASNEAVLLEETFVAALRKADSRDGRSLRHHVEDGSVKTSSNITGFLEQSFLRKTTKRLNLFVVSSTFHTPKVCELLEDRLKLDRQIARKVDAIVAVPAETFQTHRRLVSDRRYVKSMFHSIYTHMVDRHPLTFENASRTRSNRPVR